MIQFTKMTITEPKRAGKIFSMHNGQVKKETVGYYNVADAYLQSVATYQELADTLKMYSANSLILAGTSTESHLVVKPKGKANIGEASRDSENFPFRPTGGLLAIDTDKVTNGGFHSIRERLHQAIPELESYSMLQMTSTGANVIDATGEVITSITGIHTLFFVKDATDVPRALEVLHKRLWLAGYGYIFVSETGKAYDRSIVDLAMRESSQPLYMRAHLGVGMSQNKEIEVYEAELGDEALDTKQVIKDLTEEELAQFNAIVNNAKNDYAEACHLQAQAYKEKRIKTLIEQGFDENEALNAVAAATSRGDLYEDAQICLPDGEIVTVKDILSNPSMYHLAACRDPLEWDYGSGQVAKIYLNQEKPVIRSFAHHGQTFFLHEGKAPTAADDFCDSYIENLSSSIGELSEDDDEMGDIYLSAMETLKLDDSAFYGPLANIVEKGTANTEATKVGIAVGLMAQWSMLLDPFYIEIGDEKVGMNIYALSLGQSGHARKGTSSELPNKILAPGVRNRARMLKAAQDERASALSQTSRELGTKERALAECEKQVIVLSNVKPEHIDKVKAELEKEKQSIATRTASLDDAKSKLDAAFGTRGYDMRLKEIDKGESMLSQSIARVSMLESHLKAYEAALIDPEAAKKPYIAEQAQLQREITRLKSNLEALHSHTEMISDALANLGRPLKIMTSVSSGEGMIDAIRDASTRIVAGQEVHDEGVDDKRLYIDVSEFGGILAQTRRAGSIVSAVFRDFYDGRDTETNSKHHPSKVTAPYVSVSGAITPKEFNGMLFDKSDVSRNADNGFANRFMPFFVHRTKLIATPTRTEGTDEMIEILWQNIFNVYKTINPPAETKSTVFHMDDDAKALWEIEYKRITTMKAASADGQRLHGRLETNTRKIAVILATMNGETSVSLAALKAAIAWIDYSAATINKVVATIADRINAEETNRNAQKVLFALGELGGEASFNDVAKTTRLNRKDNKKKLEVAIQSLANTVPAVIEVSNVTKVKSDGRTFRAKVLKLVSEGNQHSMH